MLTKATKAETEDVHQRYLRGELTIAEVARFIDTHYFDDDEDEDEDDEYWDEDDEYWDEDDECWDEEAWDEDLRTDIPPPKSREWG